MKCCKYTKWLLGLLILFAIYITIALMVNNNEDSKKISVPVEKEDFSEDEYYINLDEAARNKLLETANTISIGDTYNEVVSKMGKPYDDQELYAKEKLIFKTRKVLYYLEKKTKRGVKGNDKYIIFYFDKDNHLEEKILNIKE